MENVRVKQLRRLIAESFDGSQSALSAKTGISLTQLGQYLSGYRNIGEKVARKIEEKLGLKTGWMDGVEPGHGDARIRQAVAMMEVLPDSQLDVVLDMLSGLAPRGNVLPLGPYIKPRTHDVSTLGAIRVMESLPEGVRHAALAHLQTFAEYYKRSPDGQALRGAVEKSRAIRQA